MKRQTQQWTVLVVVAFLALLTTPAAAVESEEAEQTGEQSGEQSEATESETAQSEAVGSAEVSVDPASRPPEVTLKEVSTLHTSVSAWSRSELFFTQRPNLRSLGGGRYAMDGTRKVFPFYQTLGVRADQLGHKGLSLHFQGWAGLDLAELNFDERVVADPTYLYLQFRDYGVDAKLGRQQVYSGVMRALHIDGLSLEYEAPFHVGVQFVGGFMVLPDRGPEWYAMNAEQAGSLQLDYSDYGSGFTHWDRELGDSALGGRIFYRLGHKANLGVSIVRTTYHGEVEHQLVGVDGNLRPLDFLAVSGDASFDLYYQDLREVNAAVDWLPHKMVSVGVDFRHTDPTLFLSHMSIFSVFSDEEYDSVGANVKVVPFKQLALYGEYHQNFYGFLTHDTLDAEYRDSWEKGFDTRLGARYSPVADLITVFDYRVFSEAERWLHQLRGGLVMPILIEGLRAHTNLYLDFYGDETAVGDGSQGVGFLGDIGLNYRRGAIEAGGSVMAGFTPYARHMVSGMMKFGYNFDWRAYR